MGKRIKLTFIDNDISVVAELLEKEAPRTCESIWKCLPFENEKEFPDVAVRWR